MNKILLVILSLFFTSALHAQSLSSRVDAWVSRYSRTDALKPGKLQTCSVDTLNETVHIVIKDGFSEQTFTPAVVDNIYRDMKSLLPDSIKHYKVTVVTDGRPIEDLIPNALRKDKDKDHSRLNSQRYTGQPWVRNASRPYTATRGLEGNHLVVWQSHGRYWKQDENSWAWQRQRLFCTIEDIFSQTFVIPYIIPMLENAGAVVFTPRERDWQSNEVIVDNDQPDKNGTYSERLRNASRSKKWQTTDSCGFAHMKRIYDPADTPFRDGTARYVATTSHSHEESQAVWMPDIPEAGRYAVYVSYQSYANSVDDATYTVFHKGGMTEFKVNQKMGGGTWVYLGHFDFDKGAHDYGMVTLSNHSAHTDGIVTADAVRFGGGMGNVSPRDALPISGLPRWAEGAKYSTFWYGFPYSLHTEPFGTNDYNNDIKCRSSVVNALAGGSIYHPNASGMGVPVDLSLAFHTDAGYTNNDSYIGSLSICTTDATDGKTGAGLDRYVSRDLASLLLMNLRTDLRKYNWQTRYQYNKNYGETRDPLVPANILEILSHQNFADMKRGYDPQFKFDLCRSVYKTIVKFLAEQHPRSYVIQPLPVNNFHIDLKENQQSATLSWSAVNDPLEPTARPKAYIVYTRQGQQGFDNGTLVHGTTFTVPLVPDEVYSFKITAVNEGGESFPSEILSAGIASQNKGTVLIVNAFTRLEGPAAIDTNSEAGFDLDKDPGVPYGAFAGFCGRQKLFRRGPEPLESGSTGASGSELEGKIFMGNTFDYAATHGNAIMLTRKHSFTSCSEQSLSEGNVNPNDYPIMDVIYGVQKNFNPKTNNIIKSYQYSGGKVIMSGANAGSPEIGGTITGAMKNKQLAIINGCNLSFDIYRDINPHSYCVPSPSVIAPTGDAFSILTYQDGSSAGIALPGRYVRLGFPLESIKDQHKMNLLIGAFLTFLEGN